MGWIFPITSVCMMYMLSFFSRMLSLRSLDTLLRNSSRASPALPCGHTVQHDPARARLLRQEPPLLPVLRLPLPLLLLLPHRQGEMPLARPHRHQPGVGMHAHVRNRVGLFGADDSIR